MSELSDRIKDVIAQEPVTLFMKGTPQMVMCGNSDRALRARYDERVLEWVPYFHHWLGDVESPDRIGYRWVGTSTSTTRTSASSR